jgi:hypothetical protein
MQLNPTLASHYTALVRPAAPLNRSKKQVLRKQTPELHDSKGSTNKSAPQNTRKNTYNTLKKGLKSQLFGPTNPSRWKQKILSRNEVPDMSRHGRFFEIVPTFSTG